MLDDFDIDEPRNPSESALDLLDEARMTAPDARLKYYKIERERESEFADDDEVLAERGYVAVSVLLGKDIVYGKRLKLDA